MTAGESGIRRRTWLGGVGLGVAGVGAGLLYRAAPSFWKQFARELGRPIEPAPARPNPKAWPDRGVHAAWIGHATVLLKIEGFTILTDPVLSARVGINIGPLTLGLKRLIEPALALEDLPKLDLVLLSHAHMDHFDLPTLRALERRDLDVVTARGTSDLLRIARYRRVQEIGWEQEARVGPAVIRGLEVRHWGARMRTDTWRGYNGYLIKVGRQRVLFGGDTAMTDSFRRVGGADLAIMPIGAYNPWIRVHCNPEQAWTMASEHARADRILPIHHRTFSLSREPVHEPLERLQACAGRDSSRVVLRRVGDSATLT